MGAGGRAYCFAVAVCYGIELKFPLCSDFCSGIMFFERVVHEVEAAMGESDVFVQSRARGRDGLEEEKQRGRISKNFTEQLGSEE